jgi:hypothetical protein
LFVCVSGETATILAINNSMLLATFCLLLSATARVFQQIAVADAIVTAVFLPKNSSATDPVPSSLLKTITMDIFCLDESLAAFEMRQIIFIHRS